MKTSKFFFSTLIAAAAMTASAYGAGEIISLNFTDTDNSNSVSGENTAGLVEVKGDNWMNVTSTSESTITNVRNHDGSVLDGVSVTTSNSTGTWHAKNRVDTLDGTLLYRYWDVLNHQETHWNVNVSTPFLVCDVYVYFSGDSNEQFSSVSINGVSYMGDESGSILGWGGWGSNAETASNSGTLELGKNALKASNVSGTSISLTNDYVATNIRGTLAGIQVVNTYTGREVTGPRSGDANWTKSSLGGNEWINSTTEAGAYAAFDLEENTVVKVTEAGITTDGITVSGSGILTLSGEAITFVGPGILRTSADTASVKIENEVTFTDGGSVIGNVELNGNVKISGGTLLADAKVVNGTTSVSVEEGAILYVGNVTSEKTDLTKVAGNGTVSFYAQPTDHSSGIKLGENFTGAVVVSGNADLPDKSELGGATKLIFSDAYLWTEGTASYAQDVEIVGTTTNPNGEGSNKQRGHGNITYTGAVTLMEGSSFAFEQGTTTFEGAFTGQNQSVLYVRGGTVNFAETTLDTLSVSGGSVNFSGSSATIGTKLSLSQDGTLNIGDGKTDTNVSVARLYTSDSGASGKNTLNVKGTLSVTGSANLDSYNYQNLSVLLGHWNGHSIANVSGVFNAVDAVTYFAYTSDQTATMNVLSGGIVNTLGLAGGPANGGWGGTSEFVLNTSGRVNIGSAGISQMDSVTLNGGTIGAYADWKSTQDMTLGGEVAVDTSHYDVSSGKTTGDARSIELGGTLSGNGSLVKTGVGTLTLSGNNTYTGGTTVENGTLAVTASNALGEGALTMNGGELQVAASTVQELGDGAQIAFNGGKITGEGTLSLGADSTVSVADQKGGSIASEIELQGNTTLTAGASATLKISGDVSGSGSLSIDGVGYVELSGNNTYSGGTIVRSSHFVVKEISALGKGTITVEDGGALFLEKAGTIKNLQNSSSSMVHLGKTVNSSGTGDVEDTLTSETTWTIEVDSELVARSGVINGSIGDSYEGFHSLEKTGDGVFSITGVGENQPGAVLVKSLNVQAGTLELVSGASALGWEGYANVSVASGAKLQIVAGANAIGAGDVTLADGAKLIIDLSKVAADADSITLGIVSSSAITLGETVLNGLTRSSEVILPEGYVSFVNAGAFSEYAKSWSYDGNVLSLTLAIPEPSMFGLLAGLGALALAGTRRRRK